MAYNPPKAGEMLYAKRDGVSVYKAPSTTSEKLLTNSEKDDHSLRDFRAGDPIGKLLSVETYPSPEGKLFLKIEYWTWEWKPVNAFDQLFGTGIGRGKNEQQFHEGYLEVDGEPLFWVRDSWRELDSEQSEQADKDAEITTALKNYPGVPAPSSIKKRTDSNGKETWLVTWANGYSADFDEFVKLNAADKVTLTTRDSLKPTTLVKDTAGSGDKKTTSLLSTTNILIGVGVLSLFGVLLFLLLRKKPKK